MAIQQATAYSEVFDFLTSSPTPQQIIDFQPSEETQERVRYLLERNQNGNLTAEERFEMDEFGRVGHLMRMLKIHAREKLAQS